MSGMNLEQYRKTLERRLRIYSACWLFYLLLMAAMHVFNESVTEHPAYSVILGAFVGGLLTGAVFMARYRRSMKDETALRRLYNQEHDERMQAIRAKAGFPVTMVLSVMLMAAGLSATFFNMTVALTLLFTAVAQLLVCTAIKFWCMRTM